MPHSHSEKQIINAWCLYDWANSAFATTMMAAVLPLFFREIAAVNSQGVIHPNALSLWGYTSAIAMVIVAVLSLLLGPLADLRAVKKRYLTIFMGIGATSTILMSFTGFGDWQWVAMLFILGSIGFSGSEVFYNSLLPHIAAPEKMNSISTRAYAMGYIGGGILLIINLVMIMKLPGTALPNGEILPLSGMQLSFISVGIWWFAFTIPILRNVPEPHVRSNVNTSGIRIALHRLKDTFHDLRSYKQLFLFILAFWFYNDGINTIIKMATLYGSEIGISTLDLVGALVVTQILGVPASLAFGRLADNIGAKKGILIGIAVYALIAIGGFFITRPLHFWILAAMVGLVQGGTQALSRSLFASMLPKDKSAEFFAFYNISGKFAGVAGPVIFAIVGQLCKSGRYAILSLLFFFIVGGIILMKVDVEEGRKLSSKHRG
ncbi:MFS transporter [bacterium]|nr:MFS transporter [bacterium]